MASVNETGFSVIICTYNPDERLLKRCLNAVSSMDVSGLTVEVILVDNNSTVRLSETPYIRDFLHNTPGSSLLTVKEQGLFHARKAGILASGGREIVFFDDDNEPDPAYIQVLQELLLRYPEVGAWGPGNVTVDFVDGIEKGLETCAKEAFQERKEEQLAYADQQSWQPCYPFGTGLCIARVYLDTYLSQVEAGKFTLTGRTGGQMSSGEDTQMVLNCIREGTAAGVAPGLKLVHMVPAKRATLPYLKRLTYGASICYSTCMNEVFPGYLNGLNVMKEEKFVIRVLRAYLLLFLNPGPERMLSLIDYIGAVCGEYMALKKPVPSPVNWVLKKLNAI